MKRVLVAVDGSAPSLEAARLALELARATGASLTMAYSVAPMLMPGEVGSRGRNAVARLFLGSVADRLVHLCTEPVLVVR